MISPVLFRAGITPVLALVFYLLPVKMNQQQLLKLAFFFWLLGGVALTLVGATRLSDAMAETSMVMMAVGLVLAVVLGVGKGKFVLAKTSKRNIDRIQSLDGPQKLFQVYSIRSWVIIEVMLLISAALTWFDAPVYWRGVVNLAVGLALMMSSLQYLQVMKTPSSTQAV